MVADGPASSTVKVDLGYNINGGGYVSTGLASSGAVQSAPALRLDLSPSVASKSLGILVDFYSGTGASSTSTLRLRGVAAYQTVRTGLKWLYHAVIKVNDETLNAIGAGTRRFRTSQDILDALQLVVAQDATTTIITPNGNSVEVSVIGMSAATKRQQPGRPMEWSVTLDMVQHPIVNPTTGVIAAPGVTADTY